MNKIVQFGFIIAVSFILTACCSTSPYRGKCGSAGDPFHINMHYGGTRQCPSPLGPSSHGPDVSNWQCFLMTHNYGLLDSGDSGMHYKYPNGEFDRNTEEATIRFQASGCQTHKIAVNGIVNPATYHKALRTGMTPYKPVALLRAGRRALEAILAVSFRDNTMHLGCTSTKTGDVGLWQQFLMNNGYLGFNLGYPSGTFDPTTVPATMSFQADVHLSATGKVDPNTYKAAINFGTNFPGGISLTGTQESRTNCGNP